MKEKQPIKMFCVKCGKQQQYDKTKSNENWQVYPNVPCECGGQFMPDFLKKP